MLVSTAAAFLLTGCSSNLSHASNDNNVEKEVITSNNSNVEREVVISRSNSNLQELGDTIFVLKIKGKEYLPEKAKTFSHQQAELMEKIVLAKKYDNNIAQKYKNNSKLIPFKDLFGEYQQVFKNNDIYLDEIVDKRNYNSKVLDAYVDYYQSVIDNFKQNRDLFVKRDGDVNMLKNIDNMYDKLADQQVKQKRFFNQLRNLRGL